MRIHILGASGAGSSTLGQHLSEKLQVRHFDTDDYYWKKTDPPFTDKNEIPERHRLILSDMDGVESWILSGAMDSWGDPFVSQFTLVIFLYVPAELRLARIRKREIDRFGSRVMPGGDMHQKHIDFMEWAQQYDQGSQVGRNLKRHEEWLCKLTCPTLRLTGSMTAEELADAVLISLKK